MSTETAAWLANVRAELAAGALLVTVAGTSGSVAIFPEDIVGKSDNELLAFIARRLAEQHSDTPKAP
jgi:hypothetical protein